MNTPFPLKTLIGIDAIAALTATIVVFSLKSILAPLLNLPIGLLTVQAVIAFCYACFSFYLTQQQKLSKFLLKILVVANTFYAVLCGLWAVWFSATATLLGTGYFLLDTVIVGVLAFWEYQQLKLYDIK